MRTFQSVCRLTRLSPSSILSQKCLWYLTFFFIPIALVAALFIYAFHVSHIIFISLLFPGRLFLLRDRPFNLKGGGGVWYFVSFRKYFSDNTRVRIYFFFQNFTLGYMSKTLNQITFFFLHQNQNILFSNIGNQNICLVKNIPPPPL